MRHHVASSRPDPAHRLVTAGACALFITIAVVTAGCSGQPSATVTPSVSVTGQVEPSPPPVPSSTSAAAPSPTSAPAPGLTSAPAPSPTSPWVVGTALQGRSAPVRLQIGTIGVDSPLMELGLEKDGSIEVPPGGFPAGWYNGGPTPGELGPAVIAGHVDMNGPGVFFRLRDLQPGDRVTVTRADGSKPVFRVTRVAQYPKDHFPTTLVYGNIDHAGLRLITCGGSFNSQTGHYEDDLVVFADLT